MRRWRPIRSSTSSRFFERRSRAYADHIHYGVPVAAKLPNLLGINIQKQRDFMLVLRGLSLDVRHIDAATRSRIENPHQRALRIAIVDVKDVHVSFPFPARTNPRPILRYSSSSNISESAAPAGTIG
jgi:hypothetical protein